MNTSNQETQDNNDVDVDVVSPSPSLSQQQPSSPPPPPPQARLLEQHPQQGQLEVEQIDTTTTTTSTSTSISPQQQQQQQQQNIEEESERSPFIVISENTMNTNHDNESNQDIDEVDEIIRVPEHHHHHQNENSTMEASAALTALIASTEGTIPEENIVRTDDNDNDNDDDDRTQPQRTVITNTQNQVMTRTTDNHPLLLSQEEEEEEQQQQSNNTNHIRIFHNNTRRNNINNNNNFNRQRSNSFPPTSPTRVLPTTANYRHHYSTNFGRTIHEDFYDIIQNNNNENNDSNNERRNHDQDDIMYHNYDDDNNGDNLPTQSTRTSLLQQQSRTQPPSSNMYAFFHGIRGIPLPTTTTINSSNDENNFIRSRNNNHSRNNSNLQNLESYEFISTVSEQSLRTNLHRNQHGIHDDNNDNDNNNNNNEEGDEEEDDDDESQQQQRRNRFRFHRRFTSSRNSDSTSTNNNNSTITTETNQRQQQSQTNNTTQEQNQEQQEQLLLQQQQEERITRQIRRTTWIRINRRLQMIIKIVKASLTFIFFGILICWFVFTAEFVVSFDEEEVEDDSSSCSSLSSRINNYYWLATFQLFHDVFRNELLRYFCCWNARVAQRNNRNIPLRIYVFNLLVVTYAIIVLRLGIVSTFLTPVDHECVSQSLFNAARSHVIFTAMAWFMIIFGYVIPFSIALYLLTRNGYSPSIDGGDGSVGGGDHQGQFGGGVITLGTSNGAPLGTVDAMKRIEYEDLSEDHPSECCICMGDFSPNDEIVLTECNHIFHKSCCEEWFNHARTCPVCRQDVPSTLDFNLDAITYTGSNEGTVPEMFARRGLFPSRSNYQSTDPVRQEVNAVIEAIRENQRR